jgi:hypothetical protein
VQPTNRRGLLGAGAAAALGAPLIGAAPTQARKVDPELPDHWDGLLRLLGRHDEVYGPLDVLACVQREIKLIAEHREIARGELHVALMRVEARWAVLAAWLSQDTGQLHGSADWTEHALRLAQEAGYADMLAFARGGQSTLARAARLRTRRMRCVSPEQARRRELGVRGTPPSGVQWRATPRCANVILPPPTCSWTMTTRPRHRGPGAIASPTSAPLRAGSVLVAAEARHGDFAI